MKYIENFGEYAVKNLKSFTGREGLGFNVNLYRGKKKIAFCIDSGNGGAVMIDFLGGDRQEEQRLLQTHCSSLPQLDTEYDFKLVVDMELFVSELVSRFEREKDINKIRKLCMAKTLFRKGNEGRGAYSVINHIYDERMKSFILNKYGNDIEIFNDVLAENRVPSIWQES